MTTTLTTASKRGKGGAPLGNGNALRHGLRGVRGPKGTRYLDANACEYRRKLEAATLDIHGIIGPYEAGLIQTAVEAVKHAWRAQYWLRTHFAELDHDQRLAHSREAVRSFAERDKALKSLGLDVPKRTDPITEAHRIIEAASRPTQAAVAHADATPAGVNGNADAEDTITAPTQPAANGAQQ